MPARGSEVWFTIPKPNASARMRLVCLPHAGAGASSFFMWGAALAPHGIEVRVIQYPGRENRLSEPLIDAQGPMTRALAEIWPTVCAGKPTALFGHSMGALLGYELAVELAQRGGPAPVHLFVSGRNPPHVPPKLPPIHDLPQAEFLEAVGARYGNLPKEVIADPEMASLIAPILRADFALVDTYRWTARPIPSMPLGVFGGTRDPWTSSDALAAWKDYTSGATTGRMIDGDHFFHQRSRNEVIAAVSSDLASVS